MAQTRLDDGREAAALVLNLYGPPHLFIATRTADQWTRPQMVPMPVLDYPRLTIASLPEGRLRIGFAPDPRAMNTPSSSYPSPDAVEVLLAEIQKDSDGDGWTDITERYLQMSPRSTDSDEDGIPDDRDPAPTYHDETGSRADEEVQILKRSVFAMFI
jgi:hypothetical protein